MAQITDRPEIAPEVDIRHVPGALVPREQELANYGPLAYPPMMANGWQEPAAPGGMSLSRLAHSFRRRWLLALFVGLALAIPAAILTWLLFPSKYEVQSLLQFQDVEGYLSTTGYSNPMRVQSYRNSQLQLAESTGVLTAVLRKPDIANLSMLKTESEPINFLQNSLSVVTPKESDLLIIRMRGEKPEEMVRVVKAVTDEYLARAAADAKEDRGKRVQVLRKRYDQNMVELTREQNLYAGLAKNAGGNTEEARRIAELLREEIHLMRNTLAADRRSLSDNEEKIALMQAQLERIRRGEVSEPVVAGIIRKNPQMIELDKELIDAKKLLSHLEGSFKDQNNPSIRSARARVAQLNEERQQLAASLRDEAIASIGSENQLSRPEDVLPVITVRAQNMPRQHRKGRSRFAETGR